MISPWTTFTPCAQTQMALYKYRAKGGKVEDARIFTGSNQDRQDKKLVYKRDSSGQVFQRQIKSAKVGEVKKCTKEG